MPTNAPLKDKLYPEGAYRPETGWGRTPERALQVGRWMSAAKLPLFLLHTPPGYGVLITRGHRTGRPRRKLVRVIKQGDQAHLVAIGGDHTAWYRNLQATPRALLRVENRWYDATPAPATSPGPYAETVTWFDYVACKIHRKGRPTETKVRELTTAWQEGGIPITLTLTPR